MNSLVEDSIVDIIKKYSLFFLNRKNILGVGLGLKHIKEIATKEPSLHILVEKKLPKNKLFKQDIIPLTFLGIKTDVIEIGSVTPENSSTTSGANGKSSLYTVRIRPLKPGYSVGTGYTTGTLGAIVYDNDNNKPYILSNNHILAKENLLKIGTPIIQPGLHDGGYVKSNVVGELSKFIEIVFEKNPHETTNINYVDCAIGEINSDIEYNDNFKLFGKIRGTSKTKLNAEVYKIGRSTGYTSGFVKTLNTTFRYQSQSNGLYKTFADMIFTTKMHAAGDSGSLLVDSNNKAVGLLVGETFSSSFFNPIEHVVNKLNIHF